MRKDQKDQEEAVMRITAQYVADLQAGAQPRLSDYLARYPQYAGAIADFVAYYHAIEAPESEPVLIPPPVAAPISAELAAQADAHKPGQVYPRRRRQTSGPQVVSLIAVAQGRQLSIGQLAAGLNLSEDLVFLLEQRGFEPSTLPRELLRRIARTLNVSVDSVQTYLSAVPWDALAEQSEPLRKPRLKVAERRGAYAASEALDLETRPDFRAALQTSPRLSAEQKAAWEEILVRERQ